MHRVVVAQCADKKRSIPLTLPPISLYDTFNNNNSWSHFLDIMGARLTKLAVYFTMKISWFRFDEFHRWWFYFFMFSFNFIFVFRVYYYDYTTHTFFPSFCVGSYRFSGHDFLARVCVSSLVHVTYSVVMTAFAVDSATKIFHFIKFKSYIFTICPQPIYTSEW